MSLFSRVVAIGLVTAVKPLEPEFVLSGPLFSEAGDFGEKVPVCKALKNNADLPGQNCRFRNLFWVATATGIERWYLSLVLADRFPLLFMSGEMPESW